MEIITKNGNPIATSQDGVFDFWNVINGKENGFDLNLFIGHGKISKDFDLSAPTLSEYLKKEGYILWYFNQLCNEFIQDTRNSLFN